MMYSRKLVYSELYLSPWSCSSKECTIKSASFSVGRKNSTFNERKKVNLFRNNTIDYTFKPVYNCTRPKLGALLENPLKYSNVEKNDFFINDDFNIAEDDKDSDSDDLNSTQSTNDAPDFLFGPLTSRIPRKRRIISTDEEYSPKRLNTTIKFDLPKMEQEININRPPLRQLRDPKTISNSKRSTYKNLKEDDTINYSEMSESDFEKNCWLAIFGSSSESEKVVIKYLTDNIGGIKTLAKKKVKKACQMHVYFYCDKEIIGFTKPSSYIFLDDPDFKLKNLSFDKEKKDNTIVPKKSTIRFVSMNKKPLLLRGDTKPQDNGIISKLWNYVNI